MVLNMLSTIFLLSVAVSPVASTTSLTKSLLVTSFCWVLGVLLVAATQSLDAWARFLGGQHNSLAVAALLGRCVQHHARASGGACKRYIDMGSR